jgi:competence protein ComEA
VAHRTDIVRNHFSRASPVVIARPEVAGGDRGSASVADAPTAVWAARAQSWRADRRVAGALLACVAVAAAIAWYRAGASAATPPAPSAGNSVPGHATSTTLFEPSTTTTDPVPASVVVDVVGAVRHNGVVRLRPGSRVVDALAAAGGAAADADLVRLNLAAPVADGARIAVPRLGAPAPEVDPVAVTGAPAPAGTGNGSGATSPSSPVDLNTASAEQLDALPGIGPATAAAIIADRQANGPFRSVDDLGRVRGIGDAKLQQLRGLVRV